MLLLKNVYAVTPGGYHKALHEAVNGCVVYLSELILSLFLDHEIKGKVRRSFRENKRLVSVDFLICTNGTQGETPLWLLRA